MRPRAVAGGVLAAVGATILLSGAAVAGGPVPETAQELLTICRPMIEYFDTGKIITEVTPAAHAAGCVAYISAVKDMMFMSQQNKGAPQILCIPDVAVGTEQMVRVVVKYLKDHPAYLNYVPNEITYLALNETWPCH